MFPLRNMFIDVSHHAYIKTHFNVKQLGLWDHNLLYVPFEEKGHKS